MNPIEQHFRLITTEMRNKRSATQMTLGEMILTLKAMPEDQTIEGISAERDSYRGYYDDLAFEPGVTTVGELLKAAEKALGHTFEGYKGGEFIMEKNTPIWIANYGSLGRKLISLDPFETEEDEY